MASAKSQLTVPEALVIVKQHQHGEIDPGVTSFLAGRAHEIWQNIQAQPSTYVLTREEFAVFTYYRGLFGHDPVAQQAVQRFWEQQDGFTPQTSKADPGYLRSPEALGVTYPHEKSEVFFDTRRKQNKSTISEDSRLTQGESTPEVYQRNTESPENLYIDWARLHTSNGEEYGLVNSMKIWVQSLTRESWDWWPLHPSFRQLREDEVRIKRYCVSDYPPCLNPILLNLLKGFRARTLDCAPQDRAISIIRSFKE